MIRYEVDILRVTVYRNDQKMINKDETNGTSDENVPPCVYFSKSLKNNTCRSVREIRTEYRLSRAFVVFFNLRFTIKRKAENFDPNERAH